jgi:hypothetical protein
MPLKALRFKPGIFRENTRYAAEGGWYDCDKIRFRSGQPEKIGGWQAVTYDQFLGICRSLWPWEVYVGVGTNLKYYVLYGTYFDITPLRATTTNTATFSASSGSAVITVTDNGHGCITGDFVTFSGAVSLGGNITATVLNANHQVTVIDANTYTFVASAIANASDVGNGGGAVTAQYEVNVGDEIQNTLTGWGSGGWGSGGWGTGTASTSNIRLWNACNFGEDLIYGPKGGAIYYWDSSAGLTTRGVNITTLPGASSPPVVANYRLVSDTSRFVLVFGTNELGAVDLDPMLIRWSDQESAAAWFPVETNQAGSLRLSRGSEIKAVAQVRQEILVWTDTALYSMQYLTGEPWWGSQLLADNISIASDRAWATAVGVTYWMGDGKFYMFDGRTQTLTCDIRLFIFNDFNFDQVQQVFCSTVEEFNEIWWFYCSAGSTTIDRYAVYNYIEKGWYYGSMARTAWVDDSVVSNKPIAADYNNRLVYHETGVDDNATPTSLPIVSYITSSETDIDDGYNFGFIWRILPDITFAGSTTSAPGVTMSLYPLQNSGSGYTKGVTPVASTSSNMSVAGSSFASVSRVTTVPIEQFTGQINTRVRGRQIAFSIQSEGLGVQWQLGVPRIDIRPDGRKS